MSEHSGFVVWAQLRVRADGLERFVTAIQDLAHRSLRDENGCSQYDVVQLDPAARIFGVYEVYDDATAFEHHQSSPHFRAWSAVVDELVEEGGVRVVTGWRLTGAGISGEQAFGD
jgi:autoinducer 2-degrading protein